ncbi:RNA polymerase sigma-70 factor [Prolixibacteraceae bacterium JC049]|nr:RNA polymerase sigma-70 factor [Prolixibacteraceae bacterium JC049]
MKESDKTLIRSIKQGDHKMFQQVFNAYYGGLYAHALKFVDDHDTCKDLLQDSFLNVWRNIHSLDEAQSISSYLFRTVQNTCLNYLKHQAVTQRYVAEFKIKYSSRFPNENEIEKALNLKELMQQINEWIDQLPDQCALVFRMSRFEGLKHKEIAKKLSLSPKTVESHIYNALRFLKRKVKEEGSEVKSNFLLFLFSDFSL